MLRRLKTKTMEICGPPAPGVPSGLSCSSRHTLSLPDWRHFYMSNTKLYQRFDPLPPINPQLVFSLCVCAASSYTTKTLSSTMPQEVELYITFYKE